MTTLAGFINELLSGRHDPLTAIVALEQERGHRVVRPGDEPWFTAEDWRPASVASVSRKTVRLVLLHAIESNRGALTRTVKAIEDAGLRPAVIDPTRELAETLKRRGWRGRHKGHTFDTSETVWTKRR